jgi:hypothetical protein
MPAGDRLVWRARNEAPGSHQEQAGIQAMVFCRPPWLELNSVTGVAHRCVTGITGSQVAKGSQSVNEFSAAELGLKFADAFHHLVLEVCDDRRSRGVGCFEPGERAAEMPQLIKSGRELGRWWPLWWHRSQEELFHGDADR